MTTSTQTIFSKKVTTTFLELYGIHPLYSIEHAPFIEGIIKATDADEEAVTDYIFNTFPHSYGYTIAKIAARRIMK